MSTTLAYFRGSFLVTALGLALAAAVGFHLHGTAAGAAGTVFVACMLAVLEISLSFDNAVVNASVMQEMAPITIGRDPFVGTGIFGYYNVLTKYRADRRLNNAIGYESPSFKGLYVLAAFSTGEAVTNSTGAIRTDPYTLSGAVHYKSGPLFAGVAYEYRNDCNNPDSDPASGPSCTFAALGSDARPNGVDQVIRFGADYTIKSTFTKVAVVYDHLALQLDAQGAAAEQKLDRDSYWASVTQGLGTNKHQIILNAGVATRYSGSNIGDTSKTGVKTYTAAYRYNVDADFMFYAAVAQILNEDNQNQKFGSNGPSSTGAGSWAAPKGSTVTGFGAGVRYMF